LNVDALRAAQTSGPNDTKHVLVTRGPIFISGKYGSRGRYIEQIKTGQNIDQQDKSKSAKILVFNTGIEIEEHIMKKNAKGLVLTKIR